MNVLCVAGARPNFMKIKPVVVALEAAGASVTVVHTGQHYDDAMSAVFFEELELRPPDHYLGVGAGTHAEQTARVMVAFEPLVTGLSPDVVVVVGDVNSTVACALVTAKLGPLVAHVEAGLRSRDWTMPEEVNRVATDRLSDYLFAPSADAVDNLRAEGYRSDQVHLVGNVMVDTLLSNRDAAMRLPALERWGLRPGEYGLVTLHRPANVDDPAIFKGLLEALGRVAEHLPLLLPAHPRTRAALLEVGDLPEGLAVTGPLGYLEFLALEAQARVVLTDSGGVQEETTVLGVPCLTLRDNTERPITVTEGTNRVVGRDPNSIVEAALDVMETGVEPRRPELWDGRAGERIAAALLSGGTALERPRPTDMPR